MHDLIDLNKFRKNIYQNHGWREAPHYSEDGVILKIFKKIGISSNPLAIEFGENRSLGTTTRAFRIFYLSRAIYFAAGLTLESKVLNIIDVFKASLKEKKIGILKFFFNLPFDFFVTPDNIVELMKSFQVSEIDLLTIDIDSYDYFIAKRILENGYQPRVCILEYNPSLPPLSELTIPYPAQHNKYPNKRIYGASFGAMNSLITEYGYKLVHISGFCNLFYVRSEYAQFFAEPIAMNEITKNTTEVMGFIDKFCQKGFIPSWISEPELKDEDLNFFTDLSKQA